MIPLSSDRDTPAPSTAGKRKAEATGEGATQSDTYVFIIALCSANQSIELPAYSPSLVPPKRSKHGGGIDPRWVPPSQTTVPSSADERSSDAMDVVSAIDEDDAAAALAAARLAKVNKRTTNDMVRSQVPAAGHGKATHRTNQVCPCFPVAFLLTLWQAAITARLITDQELTVIDDAIGTRGKTSGLKNLPFVGSEEVVQGLRRRYTNTFVPSLLHFVGMQRETFAPNAITIRAATIGIWSTVFKELDPLVSGTARLASVLSVVSIVYLFILRSLNDPNTSRGQPKPHQLA